MAGGFYEVLGGDYDRVINWEARLAKEGAFLRQLFDRYKVRRVLDTACGTGEHAALFASWGVEVTALDVSPVMIDTARAKFPDAGITWLRCGLKEAREQTRGLFDVVTCLGNSFPHVLTYEDAVEALAALKQTLRAGGAIVLQQLNYQAMALKRQRFLGPDSATTETGEVVFVRCFDLEHVPALFTMLRLERGRNGWSLSSTQTPHRAWTAAQIDSLFEEVGLMRVGRYADFDAGVFVPHESDQMIFVAERIAKPL